ncbi:MAG: TetR/AcrR family transcriptional regulator [Novosphingobium sp.]
MDARKVKSRKALGTALFALLEDKGLEEISVRELTARAGVGYATFFRHYTGLDDLLRDLSSDAVADFLALAMPLLFGNDRSTAALALCHYVEAHRKLWVTLLTRGGGAVLREQFAQEASRIAEREWTQHDKVPLELRVYFGVRGAVDIIAWWLLRRDDYSAKEVAGFLESMVIVPQHGSLDL